MPARRILILGGTADARELAARLVQLRQDVVSSLAGVTTQPLLPLGRVRSGGFGGADGLAAYLVSEKIGVLIDVTHPFATQISANAVAAAAPTGVKLLRLQRPAWVAEAGDDWRDVHNMEEAVAALPGNGKVFVSTGRKGLAVLLARGDLSGVIRAIEPLAETVPARWVVQLERPPFSFQHEKKLLEQHAITHLLTKNAGGGATATKLMAARALRIAVVMVQRPVKAEAETYSTVEALLAALV